jgi:MFS family permease
MGHQATLFCLYGVSALYALSFWLTKPAMPALATELGAPAAGPLRLAPSQSRARTGASPFVFGLIGTFTSAMELLGSPVLGRACDVRSPRFGLLVSVTAMTAHLVLLAGTHNLAVLLISIVPKVRPVRLPHVRPCIHAGAGRSARTASCRRRRSSRTSPPMCGRQRAAPLALTGRRAGR